MRLPGGRGAGGGAGVGGHATQEALTIPVSYVDVGAVDPTPGTIFATQSDVTDALDGASNFKHLQAVFDALPRVILHDVNINCATGIHRPQVGFTSGNFASWDPDGFIFAQRTGIFINGPSPATWPALPGLGNLTVTGQQVGSGDPWIDVSGTPFAAGDLKGRYLVTDAGQVLLIHDNTTGRAFVCSEISPVPTTVTIAASTGAILRNSQTDTAGAAQNFLAFSASSGQTYFNNMTIDGWGTPFGTTLGLFGAYPFSFAHEFDNVLIDRRSYFDITGSADPQQIVLWIQCDSAERDFVTIRNLSMMAPTSHANDDANFLAVLTQGFITITGSFWTLGRFGILVGSAAAQATTVLQMGNSVFDDCLDATQPSGNEGMLQILGDGQAQLFHFANQGKINEMRNMQQPAPRPGCIGLRNGGWIGITQGIANQQCIFKNNAADLVRVSTRGTLLPVAFSDGGGNTGFGVVVVGPDALVQLTSDMTATGSAGDMEIAGVARTYAFVVANSPVVELGRLNRVEKT